MRYVDSGAELLSSHGGVVEPFEVDHQYLGESINAHLLFHQIYLFALAALVTTLIHLLGLHIVADALGHVYIPSVPDSLARDANLEVHESVEGVAAVATSLAGDGRA